MPHSTYFIILVGAATGLFFLGGICHQTVRKRLWVPDGELGDTLLRIYAESSGFGSPKTLIGILMLVSRACFLGFVGLLLFAGAAALESPGKRIEFDAEKRYYAVDHWFLRPDVRAPVKLWTAGRFLIQGEDGIWRELPSTYVRGGVIKGENPPPA